LVYAGWGKGVTDEISKKCLGAFSVLSNCKKYWHFFVIFSNTKKLSTGNAGANAQKQ
jgi:hypothetical protein